MPDAAETVTQHENGLHLRNVEGSRPHLNWQAGKLEHEHRDYRGPGMATPFVGRVTLFRLLGYGYSREEAIASAKLNPNWRNGR